MWEKDIVIISKSRLLL